MMYISCVNYLGLYIFRHSILNLRSITIVGSVMVQHLVGEIHRNSLGRTLITHSKGLEIPQLSPVVSINSLLPR